MCHPKLSLGDQLIFTLRMTIKEVLISARGMMVDQCGADQKTSGGAGNRTRVLRY